ncbi:uncharacterized protein LOC102699647 [Oryza brachyantha]|uniref:uncharacterized protein LOC102699647 n=1 Tax=Oryza brachyantha TaxID=4533 RepID=UPI001ADB6889|nr:uncharacterized protein LOC102699647 [Oryza brachyantha]
MENPSSPATAPSEVLSGSCSGRGSSPLSSCSCSPTKRPKEEEEAALEAHATAAVARCGDREAAEAVVPSPGIVAEPPPRGQVPWAKLLSQCSQTPHLPISGSQICVSKSEQCGICLDGQSDNDPGCKLRYLEQGLCELEVTGTDGWVNINGKRITKGSKAFLSEGDELVFNHVKHAYIFQYSINDNNTLPSTRSEDFKDGLKEGIINPNHIEVTLENFPYYLSANTKNALFSPAFIHMKKRFTRRFPNEISSLNQRILLCGPPGSGIYQQTLVKAFAKHFGARLLIVDSLVLPGAPSSGPGHMADKSGDQEGISKLANSHKHHSGAEADIAKRTFPHSPCSTKPDSLTATSKHIFREGDRVKYIGQIQRACLDTQRGPTKGCQGRVMLTFENNISSKIGIRFDKQIPNGNDLGGLCEADHGFFCPAAELRLDSGTSEVNNLALEGLIEIILDESKTSNLIVFLKSVEELFGGNTELHSPLRRELPPGVLIIGSHLEPDNHKESKQPGSYVPKMNGEHKLGQVMSEKGQDHVGSKLHERNEGASKSALGLNMLFPNKISIEPPQDKAQLSKWKQQLERDAQTLNAKANILKIHKFLIRNEVECNDLEELIIKGQLLTDESIDKIVGYALSSHLQHNSPNTSEDEKIVLSTESLRRGLSMVQSTKQNLDSERHSENKSLSNALKNVVTKNKFEKDVLSDVISPNDIGVHFEDIGALDNVKDTLKKLVMVPLQRPELFRKGQLRKPVKGILLFGPPGTGKTLLAKAIATEAGANFINISMSSITSRWFGEGEKYVKAVFSLASKISPAVIFIDEIDSMLGRREAEGDRKTMRRIKNEFMVHWDGLRTKDQERVLVLGATNRPYDLDEAVIRRFPRRLMVDFPDALNRKRILNVILSEEELAPDVDLQSLANMTDGYSGSDLMNLCVTAAQCPVEEIIDKEEKERNLRRAEGSPQPPVCGTEDIRPLTMDDFRFAHRMVRSSVSSDSRNIRDLYQWNDQYGEGGSMKDEFNYYI